MKLQAIMNRAAAKQGTDLQDLTRLILDDLDLVAELLLAACAQS
jgi:hypothetical protein